MRNSLLREDVQRVVKTRARHSWTSFDRQGDRKFSLIESSLNLVRVTGKGQRKRHVRKESDDPPQY